MKSISEEKAKNQKLQMESSNSVSHAQFDESLEPEGSQSASGIPAETRLAANESPEISSTEDSDPLGNHENHISSRNAKECEYY